MTSLYKKGYQVLQDIVDILGTDIPHVSELEQNSVGYVSDNEHIVELSLSASDISYLPNSIGDLRSLKVLDMSNFRNNPDVSMTSMEIVTEIAKDFILPIDFDSEEHEPNDEVGCGDKCKYKIAKKQGLI